MYIIIELLVEIIGLILALNGVKNGFVLNIFSITELFLIGFIYTLEIKSKKFSLCFLFSIIGYLIFFILNLSIFKGYNNLNSFTTSLSSILIVSFSIYYFTYTLNKMQITSLTKNYFFWLNNAFFFYFTCSIFIFIFSTYILNEKSKQHRYLWQINYFLSIVYNVIISISIYKWKKEKI